MTITFEGFPSTLSLSLFDLTYFFFSEEEMYIFLFYGSSDNSLFLESSFENNNYYENYQFNWWCAPLDEESCPSCPSQSHHFCFILFFFIFFFFLMFLSFYFLIVLNIYIYFLYVDATEEMGVMHYTSGTTPNYLIDFGEDFENGFSFFFSKISPSHSLPHFLSSLLSFVKFDISSQIALILLVLRSFFRRNRQYVPPEKRWF